MRTHFRDCQAWRSECLTLSTTSNEACKLFDIALSQYVGWYEDASLGGLEGTLTKLYEADPHFVMGRALGLGLELLGTGRTSRLDKTFASNIQLLTKASKTGCTKREILHVQAIQLFADGYMKEAAETWEEILLDHPTDMLAVKFAHDTYFYLGSQIQIQDSIVRVLPSWKSSYPLYSYLYGMLAFGEVENNFYNKAMKSAQTGLELNPKDAWSVHAMAHVLEMKGEQDKGIDFMKRTSDDWAAS